MHDAAHPLVQRLLFVHFLPTFLHKLCQASPSRRVPFSKINRMNPAFVFFVVDQKDEAPVSVLRELQPATILRRRYQVRYQFLVLVEQF